MDIGTRFASALAIALLCTLAAACDGGGDARSAAATSGADADEDTKKSFIGRQAAKAIAEASRKLETENIGIGSTHVVIDGRHYGADRSVDGLPKAEITPAGELLIDGTAVPVDARQRDLLLEHRRHLVGLAQAGMAIGAQGADIAGSALTGIGGALFGGEEGRRAYEERIEAEAGKIKQEATRLCALLPALYDSQQALAASLPAFAPYATMTADDAEECASDLERDSDAGSDADTTAGAAGGVRP